ncbi:MAG: hypothetical protein K2P78_11350 [Gemmataceae bacterium]|nr:hypothetical protein [Gemmataceae bacterium]
MTDTTQITLAKALKLKNRLAGRVAKLTADVTTYNSVQQGTERPDVRAKFEERAGLVRRLTDLKAAIAQANAPVQRAIFELAELKAEVALFTGLNTKHGTFQEGYPTAGPVTYAAEFRKADADRMVEILETRIDALQDRLDGFNTSTTITVDADTLRAADAQ